MIDEASAALITQLGAGGVFAVILIREFFTMRRESRLDKISKEVEDLHEWHDSRDEDGVFKWYVRASLERSIDRLAENIDEQTKLLERLILGQDRRTTKK